MGLASHPVVVAVPAATVAAVVVVMAVAVVAEETPLVVEAARYCWLHEQRVARASSGKRVAAPGFFCELEYISERSLSHDGAPLSDQADMGLVDDDSPHLVLQ